MKLFSLIENEVIKMIAKKRLMFVLAILIVLISVFAYGQNQTLIRTKAQLSQRLGITATNDWRKLAGQQLIDMKNRLDSPYMDQKSQASTRVRMEQLQYNLDNNINPLEQSAAKFTTKFMEQSIFLFLPLLIIMLAADMVSGESSSGTIKLLLVRNVPRWKILLSKYLTLIILEVMVVIFAFVLSALISGFFFGFGGWLAPVATGFKVLAGKLDSSSVLNVPQWQYSLMVYSLAFFVSFVVGSISLMISILVKSTAASIGIIMSTLVAGNFISYFLSDWKITRYMFMVNLRLTDYLSGSFQPIEGMNMIFSITVLLGWAIAAVVISFVYFTKQDILA
ncbi:putative membrane protein [Candidatus Desulfosporosinus infrequens]|uniref:Putative membrane protein n=1 Tax=Candidatus Desulfosporosinus infrequens TaxID=2043169 RepID=A0A2U3LMV6_9FIRM|nr:putative membrane protein [Candidatus Desulfosporosinus infrequens]